MVYGFSPSKIDGSEMIIDKITSYENIKVPDSYDYTPFLSPVLDQGQRPICVPCSISSNIEWKHNLNKEKYNISLDWIYEQRDDKNASGMTFKAALNSMVKNGYITKDEYKKKTNVDGNKINGYAMLVSPYFMQRSLFVNGPFVLALYVKDSSRPDFWNGNRTEGGHAVACVGYTSDGLKIRNSWGSNWGDNGYTFLPYSEIGKVLEAWAII